jgi:uncharacterized protein
VTIEMKSFPATERSQVRRLKKRAAYDEATVHAVLDEALICHVGFVIDAQPFVIPTILARDGATIYLHGSGASRTLKTLAQGVDVCLTATLVDGVVLARSAFHHSINYRSVVVFGKAHLVTDRETMLHGLQAITDKVVANRWREVRAPSELALKQTHVLALPLGEASAKVRSGPPIDDAEDYLLPVWAGVVPMTTQFGSPQSDARVLPNIPAIDLSRVRR